MASDFKIQIKTPLPPPPPPPLIGDGDGDGGIHGAGRRQGFPSPPSRPALPGGAEEYVRDSISFSLGLPVPDRSLRLKLLASEDLRRRLQDHVFALEEDLYAAARRIDLLKKESVMNAEGIRRCVEEKEAVAAARDRLAADVTRLEKEVTLYERDLERAMESCDDLARENEDLRARLKDNPDILYLKLCFGIFEPRFNKLLQFLDLFVCI